MIVELRRHEVELDVGSGVSRLRCPHEGTGFRDVAHARSRSGDQIAKRHADLLPAIEIVAHGTPAFARRAEIQMILQVLPDLGTVGDDWNLQLRQIARGSHPREKQQLWRGDRTGRQDDFASRAHPNHPGSRVEFHSNRACSFEADASHERMNPDLQVPPGAYGLQICRGGAAPRAVSLRYLIEADTALVRAVEIGVVRQTAQHPRLDENARQRVTIAQILHGERSARPVIPAGASRLILGLHEER
jgi:hypothetical protein